MKTLQLWLFALSDDLGDGAVGMDEDFAFSVFDYNRVGACFGMDQNVVDFAVVDQ